MSKKQDIRNIILFVLLGILIFGVVGYKAYKDFFEDKSVDKKLISLDLYGYSLKKRDTDIFKTNFKELEKVLNEQPINYEEYVKLISKLFVIDLYTLNNKVTSTDIGGLEFLHKDLRENFKENMGATLYRNLESNLDGKRTQKLPEVSNVTVDDVFETKYTYNKTEYEAYLVTVSIEYKENLGYQNKIKLTVIKDDKFLYIVKGE